MRKMGEADMWVSLQASSTQGGVGTQQEGGGGDWLNAG